MRTGVSTGTAYCSLTTRPVTHQRLAQSSRPPGGAEQLPASRQILHQTLVDRRLQQQRDLVQEASLQQQEEDEWLQSVQAEADADARNQFQAGSVLFAQESQAAASQRPPEAPMRSQQLGTTKLGRQRLQKKADSFADMVHLVAVADVEHADKPKVSSSGATGLGTRMDADEANHGMAVSNSHHSEVIARTGQHAADRDLGRTLTSADSQHTHGSQSTTSAPIAPGDHQTYLQEGHNASTASLRSTPNHKLAVALIPQGHADDASAAMPQSDAAYPQSFLPQDSHQQYQHGKVDWLSSTPAEDAQKQEGLRRRKRLQRLEAAAANWRQRCGSRSWTSACQPLVPDSSQVGPKDDVVNGVLAAQPWQPQHAMHNLEARPSMTQDVEEGAVFVSDTALASAEADYDDRHSAFSPAAGIPPPPPLRPSGRPQAGTKASWAAALRGDIPVWLL